jgi:hypothetical protein
VRSRWYPYRSRREMVVATFVSWLVGSCLGFTTGLGLIWLGTSVADAVRHGC